MDATIGMTQFGGAAVVVYLMQKIKDATWFPWLQHEGQIWIKRSISVGSAFLIHTEISHAWNPGTIEGSHVLILSIPPLGVIMEGVWHWFCQFAMQESLYQVTVNKVSITTNKVGEIPAMIAPSGSLVAPAMPTP